MKIAVDAMGGDHAPGVVVAVSLPTPEGSVLLADVGAHAEAVADHLTQSAARAGFFCRQP